MTAYAPPVPGTIVKTWPFRQKPLVQILGLLGFGACAAFFAHKAMTNDSGLIINHAIPLDPGQATIFYWMLCGCGAIFVLLFAIAFVQGMTGERRIVLTDRVIQAPKSGVSMQLVTVPLDTIEHLEISQVQGQRFLKIHYRSIDARGSKLVIASTMLPSRAAFEEMVHDIETSAVAARPH